MHSHALAAALALASSLLAQTAPFLISPKAATQRLGDSNNNIPFSWTPTAYQQVHSASSFSAQGPLPLQVMRMRMASGFTNYAGKQIDVELHLAQSPNEATNASSVFASNIVPSTEVNVLVRKLINLPTVPDHSWVVAPFAFDNLFIWPGSHLAWRAIVWGNSAGNQIFTYPLDAWSAGGSGVQLGNGCTHAQASQAASLSAYIPGPGGGCNFYSYSQLSASVPAVLTLGASNTSWFSIPLPFDLTPFNAPGCRVFSDVLTTLTQVTGTNGQATFNLSLPNTPFLAGQVFYSQGVFLDPAANGMGLWLTNSLTNTIGGPPGIARIYAIGNPNATSGTVENSYGMAIGFN